MASRTRLLIDGDHIVYRAAAAVEETVHWEDDVSSVWADRGEARKIVERHVDTLMDEFEADEYLFAVSDSKDTFRHRLFPDYKGNRKKQARPIILGWLREWAVEGVGAKAIHDIEADDVIGISATHPNWQKWRQVIVTDDKDLRTIPGEIYFDKNDELVQVSDKDAIQSFAKQILAGDAADGFPGCPGIGEKRAERIVNEIPDSEYKWPHIVAAYEKAGKTEEDALLQARLAYILQFHNYDFKTGEVQLWTPPKNPTS